MTDRKAKRPRDANQLAKFIVDVATGEAEDEAPDDGKDRAASELGRLGGLKGGKARAERLSAEERKAIARRAAAARWQK
ncbi:MAG TPA: histone H1 [Thermohalobaculum sp.]|nr:histone H1 [Thermohalobaculum sp.]